MAGPGFYQKAPKDIAQVKAKAEGIKEKLLKAYERWEYLEGIKKSAS